MTQRFVLIGALLSASLLSGCATTAPRASYGDVETMVHERVGVRPRMEASPAASPAPGAASTTGELLSGTLDAARAVEVALANNASLRAQIEELGLANADLMQARLLSNPKLHAAFRFPSGGGAEGTGNEIGLDMDFLSLLTRPLKTRMATAQFEQAKLKLGHEILKVALDVKAAFFTLQATLQRLELRRTIVESMQTAVELAERQLGAENISTQDLGQQRAAYQEASMELRHDEAEASVEREKLALLMGVQDGAAWKVAAQLPAIPGSDPDLKRLESLALTRRWDLLAASREPAVLQDALKLAKLNVFSGLEAGVDSERDFGGERGIGPDAQGPLPIFDQGQAAKAKVRAQLRRSRYALTALEQQARYDVRSAWTHLVAARKDVESYETNVLPLRRQLLDETLKRYNFMLEGVYQLLEAKRSELQAQRGLIDARRDYWTRWSELERAVGGKVPPELVPAAPRVRPESIRAESPPAAAPHQHGGQH